MNHITPAKVELSSPVNGTWTGASKPSFQPFAPGVYTVVAGDEWAAVAILHFIVEGQSSTTGNASSGSGTTTMATSSFQSLTTSLTMKS